MAWFNQYRILLLLIPVLLLCLIFLFIRNSGIESPLSQWDIVLVRNCGVDCERNYAERMVKLKEGCGEICNTDIIGQPSLFFPEIRKQVNCSALISNKAIDENRPRGPAPRIPDVMLDAFTYGGKIPIVPFSNDLLNQYYLGATARTPVWHEKEIDDMKSNCSAGTLLGNYGFTETSKVFEGLKRMQTVKGGHVLVIGSENPWLEACILAAGASRITTLEYGSITSYHPQVKTINPSEMREMYLAGKLPLFDAVATFSSVEHSGLGRYGDALNPWGDLQAIARAWCITKPNGELLLGVMTAADDSFGRIEFNAHRLYGSLMFSHLSANWKQKWRGQPGGQVVHVFQK